VHVTELPLIVEWPSVARNVAVHVTELTLIVGFIIGVILTRAVVTAVERRGRPKTVQQGNRE